MKARYLTFLFDPVTGRVLPGTLHRQPDPLQPEGAAQWKVIRDAGSVELIAQVDGATTEIGKARWRDGSLEDLAAVAPHDVTDAQWHEVEAALREHVKDPTAAPEPATVDEKVLVVPVAAAPASPRPNARTYITFHLDLAADRMNRAVPGTVAFKPDEGPLPNDFVWKVSCDVQGAVSVLRKAGKKSRLIGTARWRVPAGQPASLGKLVDRVERKGSTPNENQWGMVEAALMAELAKPATIAASVPIPDPPPAAEPASRPPPPAEVKQSFVMKLLWPVLFIAGSLAIGIGILKCRHRNDAPVPVDAAPVPLEQRIATAPTFGDALALAKPAMTGTADPLSPAAIQLAHYTKLRWVDVSGANATSHALAVASPAAARGKLMCTAGDISDIARREVGGRWVYFGHLRSDDGERFAFAAVGTGGDLGNRMPARLCGAVVGSRGTTVALFGLFDLPENRMPLVEK